jgi:hypothetical protein
MLHMRPSCTARPNKIQRGLFRDPHLESLTFVSICYPLLLSITTCYHLLPFFVDYDLLHLFVGEFLFGDDFVRR